MTGPGKFVKDRNPVRHFAVHARFLDGYYFAVCGQSLSVADMFLKVGPRLTNRWCDVTCKRCLRSRWGGSVTR